jgi:hypothetical protein
MEVHHHPDLHHKKKNFKEYFLEFLMIFLAVFMGFIAENIREHFTEEKIGRQYLENFRQELLNNKNLYHSYDMFFKSRVPVADSLIKLFVDKKENNDLKTTARFIKTTRSVFVSSISKAAYEQMVNSGGLKYIDDAVFRDSLTRYEGTIHNFEKYNEIVDDYRSDAFPNVAGIEPLYSMALQDTNAVIVPFPELTQKERTEILNFYAIYFARYYSDKILVERLNKTNGALITMLNKMLDK